ncbi:MAG: gluconeogenesis factor YvcK family protein [Candidatus Campbellbacteria bacterium]|nr:gluconeogenesis factor YvcK family protein [Candidatus Campbellbacteria bacterium]
MKKVVTIGGGGGHSKVLEAIKEIPDIQITGICPSTDSGGSTGVLREEYDGSGYTGDLTRCILALCDDEVLVDGLSYRYESGPLHTHSVKNLLFHALEKVSDTYTALEEIWKVCDLGVHRVLPVTTENTELCARLTTGNTVTGETNIDTIAKNPLWNPNFHSISDIYLKPEVRVSDVAANAIKEADWLIVSPGNLYSSTLPTLLPLGMKEAIASSSAKIVIILNIMTKQGETDDYTAEDFIKRIEGRVGKKADYILHNNVPIPEDVFLRYSLERKVELKTSDGEDPRIIPSPLATFTESGQIFSSPEVIREEILKLLQNTDSK